MLKKIIKKRAYTGNKIEDNLLFVTLQTQIVGLDMNNGYEQIFLSDKLSNMCNFYYDKDTKQLLVYNKYIGTCLFIPDAGRKAFVTKTLFASNGFATR